LIRESADTLAKDLGRASKPQSYLVTKLAVEERRNLSQLKEIKGMRADMAWLRKALAEGEEEIEQLRERLHKVLASIPILFCA
jgi:hypothetical protein